MFCCKLGKICHLMTLHRSGISGQLVTKIIKLAYKYQYYYYYVIIMLFIFIIITITIIKVPGDQNNAQS